MYILPGEIRGFEPITAVDGARPDTVAHTSLRHRPARRRGRVRGGAGVVAQRDGPSVETASAPEPTVLPERAEPVDALLQELNGVAHAAGRRASKVACCGE